MQDYSYIGVGKAYLQEIGANTGLIEVGNASALSFTVNEDVKELKDFTKTGGGTQNEVRRIDSVEVSITIHDINAINLGRAVYGAASNVASAAVVGESLTVYPNALSPFAAIPRASVAPVITTPSAGATARANTTPYALGAAIKPATPNGYYYRVTTAGTSGGTIPTYPTVIGQTVTDGAVVYTTAGKEAVAAGVDYDVTGSGIFVYSTSTGGGEVWTVGYTKEVTEVVQALTNSSKEYRLYFDGLNEARSGKPFVVDAFRVKIGAAQNIDLIGDDYAGLELTGKVLKDASKTGAGISQYFKAQMVT